MLAWGSKAIPLFGRLVVCSIVLAAGSRALGQVCSTPPSEARSLSASGSSTIHLSWLQPSNSGGSTTILYDVLRSASPGSFSAAQCLASGISALSYDDSGFAGSGYYLVRSRNACGDSLGASSNGVPRTGSTCLQSDGGQCFNAIDCVTTACCGGYCRNLTNNTENCGGCGNACFVTNGAPNCIDGQCGIASCNTHYFDCNVNPGDGCETNTTTDVLNCGACGAACPSPANTSPTCIESACDIVCTANHANCDGSPANGCECDGNLCCVGSCPPPHSNGLGQTFEDCAASGAYSLSLAVKARSVWPFIGTDNQASCGGMTSAVIRQTASQCAVWVYTSTTAGRVRLNSVNNSCVCPTTADPMWF
jgi:hypothetical protein